MTDMHTYILTNMHTNMQTCMLAHLHACIHTYMHILTYKNVHTHEYIHETKQHDRPSRNERGLQPNPLSSRLLYNKTRHAPRAISTNEFYFPYKTPIFPHQSPVRNRRPDKGGKGEKEGGRLAVCKECTEGQGCASSVVVDALDIYHCVPRLWCNISQHTAAHCNTLQHTATYCITLQQTARHCNTLPHTATHCNVWQCAATHCNTL